MKLVHIMLAGPYTEGMAYQDNLLPACQAELGHDVTFIASCYRFQNGSIERTYACNYIMQDDVRLIRVPFKKYYRNDFITQKIRDAKGLFQILEKIKPDQIMLHDPQTKSVNAICKYVYAHPKVELIIDSHADKYNSGKNILSKYILHKLYYRHYVKKASKAARHFYALTCECKKFCTENYRISSNKIEILPLGGLIKNYSAYKLEREKTRAALGVKNSEILFVHSGKMNKQKKTEDVLDAFMRVTTPNFRLVIVGVGDGSVEGKIRQAVYQDSRIKYLGWKSGSELESILCAADAYVQPGTQSSTMQTAACCRCALILYPYESHKYLLGNAALYAENEMQLEQCFQKITRESSLISELSEETFKIACEELDYKSQAMRVLNR